MTPTYEIPPALTFPVSLSEIRRGIDATDEAAARLVDGLDDEAANWHPAPAAWSIAQCLDHLAVSVRQYGGPIGDALERAPRAAPEDRRIAPGRPSVWFIREIEPPPRRRTKTPSKIAPVANRPAKEVLEHFLAANRDLRALLDRMAGVDPNRVRFVNPLVPLIRFTVGTGVAVMLAHHRRHLLQAYTVRNTPEFPVP